MRRRGASWVRFPIAVLLALAILGLGYANYSFVLKAPGGNDFLPRWVGAQKWLSEGVSPYDPEVTLTTQRMIYGRPADPSVGEDIAHFAYPLPVMIFFLPFGLMNYTLARAVWMTLLEISLPLLMWMSIRLARWQPPTWMVAILVVFSVSWYHGLRSVMLGQFAVFEALLMVGALLAIDRDMDSTAGILLALSIAKPQMPFLLIPFVLIWAISRRRWRLVIWTVGSTILLLGVSIALIPDWPMGWLRQLVEYPSYTEVGSPVSILAGWIPRFSTPISYVLGGSLVLYMLWEWALAMKKDTRWFQWTAAMTIVITNLVALRTATTNYVVMLPALILMFRVWSERWGRRGNVGIVVMLVILIVGLWVLFLSTITGNVESPWMFIPLPLVTLVGLWWIRWWALKVFELPMFNVGWE